jgi:hypothetical protein
MRRNDSPELLLNATKTRGIEIFRGGQHASEWWSVCVGIGGQYASEYTYLLDKVIDSQSLANALYQALQKNESPLFRIPLKASALEKGFASDERWKVIVNTQS